MASPTDFEPSVSSSPRVDGGGVMTGGGQQRAEEIAARLADVRRRIAEAAARAGRSRASVTLVAVSKLFDVSDVLAARRAGQSDFGESRAQELKKRLEPTADLGVRWHFVGRLQRNKVADVVGKVTLIHSVDRLPLAEAIAARAEAIGRVQGVLVQVNAGNDPAKAGVAVEDAAALVAKIRSIPWISCQGLMTIPPLDGDPRAVFRTLRELRDGLRAEFPEVLHLSMGMSADFEVAVEEGATIVRLGEVVFGPRDTS